MTIRKLLPQDIPACAGILMSVYNNDLWQCRWTEDSADAYLTDLTRMPGFLGYVIEDSDGLRAALLGREKVWWNANEIHVEELFVKPEYQRMGYGSLLLGEVGKHVRAKHLAGITLSTNRYAPAPHFYQKNGFEPCEHVLFMCKER